MGMEMTCRICERLLSYATRNDNNPLSHSIFRAIFSQKSVAISQLLFPDQGDTVLKP